MSIEVRIRFSKILWLHCGLQTKLSSKRHPTLSKLTRTIVHKLCSEGCSANCTMKQSQFWKIIQLVAQPTLTDCGSTIVISQKNAILDLCPQFSNIDAVRDHSNIMSALVGGEGGSENANFCLFLVLKTC